MAAYLQPGTPAKEAEQEEFTSTSPPSPMDYAERTKALNAGQPLEPLVQVWKFLFISTESVSVRIM